MTRPTREETYMEIAHVIAKRGTCERAKVGCVITKDNRIISTGYNGPPKHHLCRIEFCDIRFKCTHAIHAEANAIVFAAKEGIALSGSKLYSLTAPCVNCARLILQAGITHVFYEQPYTDTEGISLLAVSGIQVLQIADLKRLENYGTNV